MKLAWPPSAGLGHLGQGGGGQRGGGEQDPTALPGVGSSRVAPFADGRWVLSALSGWEALDEPGKLPVRLGLVQGLVCWVTGLCRAPGGGFLYWPCWSRSLQDMEAGEWQRPWMRGDAGPPGSAWHRLPAPARDAKRGGSGLESCGTDSGSEEQPLPGHSVMGNEPILALRSLAVLWAGLGNPEVERGGAAPGCPGVAGQSVAPQS